MMGGFGGSELLTVLFFLIVAYLIFRKSSGTGNKHIASALVLSKFDIHDDPKNKKVDIVGRASGLTAWILTNLGFSKETRFSITDDRVIFKNSSISGQNYRVLPFTSAASTQCGYSKSTTSLILGSIIVIGGLIWGLGNGGGAAMILGIIVGGILLYNYYTSKMILISVETNGGIVFGLSFKRSIIENVSVDIDKATKVIDILNHKITRSHKSKQ